MRPIHIHGHKPIHIYLRVLSPILATTLHWGQKMNIRVGKCFQCLEEYFHRFHVSLATE